MARDEIEPYVCKNEKCKHAYYHHRESTEWQMLNGDRKKPWRPLPGCTVPGCPCEKAL